ncbi:MAG: protein kinase, partial [Planctomycetota bacterium]
LCDGPDFREAFFGKPTLRDVCLHAFRKVLDGLSVAHEQGVVHGSLSPEILHVGTDGETLVGDWDLARRSGTRRDSTGSSAAYLSPEQARGEELSPASDVYSIGILLYELLTGQHPHGHPNSIDDFLNRLNTPITAPSEAASGLLPAELDAPILRCLEQDASQRFTDAEELLETLEELS